VSPPGDTPLLAARLRAQLLSGPPAAGPVEVAERLLAVQAQDPLGARLAVRARGAGLTVASVEHALTQERTLVISWLCRGTLHLVRSEDYPWLHALTAPRRRTGVLRRLTALGVGAAAAQRGVNTIERSLTAAGPMTREQLRLRLDSAGVPTQGQALVHLLNLASQRGLIVRGPMIGADHAYALVRDWLGPQPTVDREGALGELARRYLAGHAPAGDRDLAWWSGLALRDARAGLSAIASDFHRRSDGLFEPTPRQRSLRLPPPRLLGPFDPVLLGWRSRRLIVGDHASVVTSNGLFRPIALVRGRAVATWAMPSGRVTLAPFDELAKSDSAALEAEARDVARYLAAR